MNLARGKTWDTVLSRQAGAVVHSSIPQCRMSRLYLSRSI